ncbi:Gamma-glutamyl hydrolase [Habropoda laboriosa]|uniref:folate gamma-glutamyl hydrolase n=1 Tax=Habropoda laboriosa TaxID=597456 RepID=A0A0L7R4R6_9HYME|nr:Gamma-glutamyl hydrolase [Habropoda laboriosa]
MLAYYFLKYFSLILCSKGILSQEISEYVKTHYDGDSYIAASYVKFIESAGGRVVPIWIGKDESYYEDILGKINGVLWPGGKSLFTTRNGYADAGYKIYNIAERMNRIGDYFPIFGICLGFELLTYVVAQRTPHRINCSSQGQSLPLEFTPDYRESRMFKNIPLQIQNILQYERVTVNFHNFCVTENKLKKIGVSNKFRILSLNEDWNGLEFISSLEHITLPFYGTQFHPEKNPYEWIRGRNISHTENSIKVSRYFADFFLSEARKNHHSFPTTDKEAEALIYNYPVTYTTKTLFLQCYLFNKSDTRI